VFASARLAPLRSPAYRRFLVGTSLSQTSSWIYYTAVTWALLESDGTAAAVAFLPLVLVLPVPFTLVAAGLFTDRRGPRHVLLLSQLAIALVVGLAALLAAVHALTFVPTLAIGLLVGIFTGFETVPSQALIVRLVDAEEAPDAYGTSLLTIGTARIIGGPLGGALVGLGGAGPAFSVAAVGMLLALVLFMGLPRTEGLATAPVTRSLLLDFGRAVNWAKRARAALLMITIDALLSALIFPYLVLMPVVARDLVGGRATDLGYLIAAGGVGVMLGAFSVQTIGRRIGQGRLLIGAVLAASLGVAGLGLSSSLVLSALLAALVAGSTNAFGVTEGLLLQTMTPPQIRGRVLAIDGVIANIANPVGILTAGLLVDRFGGRVVLVGMAVIALVGVLAILGVRRPVVLLDVADDGALVDARRAVRAEQPLLDDQS
jgi:predicted MFS family arabinose efflux permease